ncbi:MAG: hypothetical protein A2504_13315 [Bdellovibrionales bacterium RIFOXYD12_FULL_39_22]|nr:MAG: hypothetical protein A2385_01115 [Bdellovibrionales bacterium RIFOXYB1_FULL_39_21]OFZ43606.1 MAG: hypothetical protein A2485_12785 [Bdellovibrionales bacterium RIFOXYC12_FULL_39_17]OFZ44625.1 MAG: hypothetical protein A2404_10475 [Bdellovibrionales bacterium RIFOXYC1_FULL_39_130]OFZ73702.1 MAG: hypothetical protein A2451_01475 [Bdellovibrionales bacterium RIFOXYC2_FULL_39_8]OFZ76384.1 MAG: hypothetical protein A2560_07095 [Bdellovibrionales bacterium RIFOXYD1_FULL_39_84]OFZ94650.1 MAG:
MEAEYLSSESATGATVINNAKYPLPIILYDSRCQLCERFKVSLERANIHEKYNIVSIHDELIYQAYPVLNPAECKKHIHMIEIDGSILKGPDVIARLIDNFPIVSKFAWLIESDMGKKTLDYFYNMASRYRENVINRCGNCNK